MVTVDNSSPARASGTPTHVELIGVPVGCPGSCLTELVELQTSPLEPAYIAA